MSDPFQTMSVHPSTMSIRRAKDGIQLWTEDVASAPFLTQMLLSSRVDGELTAMRAFLNPGVITHWHSHPRGQLLFALEGVGRVQREGGEVVDIRAGDSVWFAPDERHWHGASAASPFSYVSVQQVQDGAAVRWFEQVDRSARHS